MAHKPEQDLKQDLRVVGEQVEVGSRWQHYKDPAYSYRILGHAINEETDEPWIVYQAEYGECVKFIRRAAGFLSMVEVDGQNVPRFARVEPANML
jgi:hypothetical protein